MLGVSESTISDSPWTKIEAPWNGLKDCELNDSTLQYFGDLVGKFWLSEEKLQNSEIGLGGPNIYKNHLRAILSISNAQE